MDKQEFQQKFDNIQEKLTHHAIYNGLAVATAIREMREQTVKLVYDEAVRRQNAAGDEWEEMSAFHEITDLLV